MTDQPKFDKQDQFDKVRDGLIHGEEILCVYDAIGTGTGFIGVTAHRVVLQDNGFVGKKTALTSLPFSRINAISVVSDKSVLGKFASSSELSISAGGNNYSVEFRGVEKAR